MFNQNETASVNTGNYTGQSGDTQTNGYTDEEDEMTAF